MNTPHTKTLRKLTAMTPSPVHSFYSAVIENNRTIVLEGGQAYCEEFVQAVNAHDALVEALKKMADLLDSPRAGEPFVHGQISGICEAAIKKAEGKTS